MIEKANKKQILIFVLVLLSFMIGSYFYPQMPDKMASHWNAKGEVDGYNSNFWGIFLIPYMLSGLFLLYLLIPRIDPLKQNIEKFRKYYDNFFILFFIYFLAIYLHGIFWNLGIKISPNIILPISCSLLFFYVGILCENSKRNWFVGIRTPWTLSSDAVWGKTHRITAKLFKASALIVFIGAFFREHAVFFILVPVTLTAVFSILYSYFAYQKEIKQIK